MKGKKEEEVFLKNKEEGRAYIEKLAGRLERGDVVLLQGELGAGKTTIVQWIAACLGVTEPVTSPTFALVNHYLGQMDGEALDIYHLDLYRLEDPQEIEDIDYEDYFYPDQGLTFVEWPEMAEAYLPPQAIRLRIEKGEGEERKVELKCD